MSDLDYIIETFDFLSEWDERYQFLTEIGEQLDHLPPEQKNKDAIVHGCASNVWITATLDQDNHKLIYRAEAEQPIIRGLVYLALQVFTNKTPDEVLDTSFDETLNRLKLDEHLSTQRHIGMYALIRKMKSLALPYSSREQFET